MSAGWGEGGAQRRKRRRRRRTVKMGEIKDTRRTPTCCDGDDVVSRVQEGGVTKWMKTSIFNQTETWKKRFLEK